jgi:hypothetical protein
MTTDTPFTRNMAKCRLCGDVIESRHTHDFVRCKCREIFVDGGLEYLRAGASDFNNFIRIDKSNIDEIETSD